MILKLFAFFMWFYVTMNGISLWIRQKDFDIIAFLFYPKSYGKDWWFNLTSAPYWLSFVLGAICIFGPIYVYFRQKENGNI